MVEKRKSPDSVNEVDKTHDTLDEDESGDVNNNAKTIYFIK
jgi:hypothetical protein